MNKEGFTLIELLIVISIIGILMSVSLVAVTSSQKQARDAQRRSDLSQYRIATESYAASNNSKYPSYADESARNAATSLQPTYLTAFMSSAIADPTNSGNYIYYYRVNSATATQYVLYGGLETGGFWEICSNGKSGKVAAAPDSSACTLP